MSAADTCARCGAALEPGKAFCERCGALALSGDARLPELPLAPLVAQAPTKCAASVRKVGAVLALVLAGLSSGGVVLLCALAAATVIPAETAHHGRAPDYVPLVYHLVRVGCLVLIGASAGLRLLSQRLSRQTGLAIADPLRLAGAFTWLAVILALVILPLWAAASWWLAGDRPLARQAATRIGYGILIAGGLVVLAALAALVVLLLRALRRSPTDTDGSAQHRVRAT